MARVQLAALVLKEAAMHRDVASRLQDEIQDQHRQNGKLGGYIDHSGDGESGDVIYSENGDTRKAPYELGSIGGKATANIDMDNSTNVVPMTTYQEEADDDDQYAAMEESFKAAKLYTELPLYERFISKAEREKHGAEDFAGKDKSYPIFEPGDVMAAVHAMGRAGSANVGTSTLKSRIISIAKRKGWAKYLPKSWQGDSSDSKESKIPREIIGALKLCESWNWKEEALSLIESSSDPVRMKLKLIAPGKGSSAFYPSEVLKRDGPNVFTKGTHIYINHATTAEEAARPEGDWHKLAGALDGNAYWDESAKQGAGLYADGLFTSDYAPLIKEKAAFTGMSIRASGVAESGKTKDGVPVLKELTSAESVDVVTRAGAGGMILSESANPADKKEPEMDLKEAQKLVQEAVAAATAPLLERNMRADAKDEAEAILEGVDLTPTAKRRVIEASLKAMPLKEGKLDLDEFRKVVVAEAKDMAKILSEATGGGRVFGMGLAPAPTEADTEKLREAAKRAKKEAKRMKESEDAVFARLTGIHKVEAA